MARERLEFDADLGCYCVQWSGNLTAGEMLTHIDDLLAQDWFRPGLKALHDMRDARVVGTPEQLADFLARYADKSPDLGGGDAAVIVCDEDSFSTMRAFVQIAEPLPGKIRVFYSYAAAKAWLQLPDDRYDPFR